EYQKENDLSQAGEESRFLFRGPSGAAFDIAVYYGRYGGIREMDSDVTERIGKKGDVDFFQ
ncbi:hypothetical protein, partial [Treponema sp. R6D11]